MYILMEVSNCDWENEILNRQKAKAYYSEIEILNRYNIDYHSCKSNHDLLYLVEECLEEIDDEELEWLSSTLSERSYYTETNK